MINIGVKRQSGRILQVTVEGHAEFAENGKDIVCAAVSGILCTAVLGLQKVAKLPGQYETGAARALIAPADTDDVKGQAILETMILGFEEIVRQYAEFVSIEIQEVN